jgi:hypothetical protein
MTCGRVRGLYLVPERQIPRARHAPAGRALHLVEREYLLGGPRNDATAIHDAIARYKSAASVRPGDHVLLAVNRSLAFEAGHAWSAARLLTGSGPDGADRALLTAVADLEWVVARFDRVIVGSGDGIFVSLAEAVRALGIAVGVVAPEHGLSRHLRCGATFVRLVPVQPTLQVVA